MFNIFFIAFAAVAVGLFLSILITRSKENHPSPHMIPEDDSDRDPKGLRALTLSDLFVVGERLCLENKLRIKEKLKNSDRETYWIVESENEFFFGNYVLGFCEVSPTLPCVSLQDLLEFKDFVKSTGTNKGFYLTTGYFTRDCHQPLEGPKITLYNRLKVYNELKRFGLI